MVKQIFEIFITNAESSTFFLYPTAFNTSEELTAQISLSGREKIIGTFKHQENGCKGWLKAQLDHLVAW